VRAHGELGSSSVCNKRTRMLPGAHGENASDTHEEREGIRPKLRDSPCTVLPKKLPCFVLRFHLSQYNHAGS